MPSTKTRSKTPVLKSPDESLVTMTQLVLPEHTNALGTIFGGVVMSWIDIAGAIASMRHSGRTCVTASIDELHFLAPLRQGYVVNISAQVTAVHTTSCEVRVLVQGENPMSGKRFHTARSYLTFVCLDEEGKPEEMPKLKTKTKEQAQLEAEAGIRKKSRESLREELRKAVHAE